MRLSKKPIMDFLRYSLRLLLLTIMFVMVGYGSKAFAKLPNLRLFDPYFLGTYMMSAGDAGSSGVKEVYTGLQYGNIGLNGGSLSYFDFVLQYGVNEVLLLGLDVPYLFIGGAGDSGVLGNISAYIKFSIIKRDFPVWRWQIIADLYFRFATSVIEEAAVQTVGTTTLSYFPFGLSTTQFAPSVIGSFLLGNVMLNLVVGYHSENAVDAGIFEFDVEFDRLNIQFSTDYYFKIKLRNPVIGSFIIRPVVYFDYRINISPSVIQSDTLAAILECNFKLGDIIFWKINFSMPLYSVNYEYRYELGIQVGKTF